MALELNSGGATPEPFDLPAQRRALAEALERSGELDALTARIDVNDMNSILTFGSEAAGRISGASDAVLRDMAAPGTDDSGALMKALAELMGRLDPDALQAKPTLLGKLFGGPRRQLDRVLDDYHAMGDEVERVYAGLRSYERQLQRSNRQLEALLEANAGYFHELEKYVVAGDRGCREIADYIALRQAALDETGDRSIVFELQTLNHALSALKRRAQDLRTAEAVALQSISMIHTVRLNNAKLAQKINSAFIVTLPTFRQALSQAVQMKRRRLQNEALSALDRRAGARAKADAANPAGGVEAEALERSRRAIMAGIDEARELANSAREQRERDREQLERIKRDYAARSGGDG